MSKPFGILCVNEALRSFKVFKTPGYDTLEQAQERCERLSGMFRKFVYHQPVTLPDQIPVGKKVQGRE